MKSLLTQNRSTNLYMNEEYILFIDEFHAHIDFASIYMVQHKSQAFFYLNTFKTMIENQFVGKIKAFLIQR